MRPRLLLIMVVLMVVIAVSVSHPALGDIEDAHTAQNLTLTTGAGSAWVTGGYDFQATAYATKAGFKPLHNKGALTVVMWVMPDTDTNWQHLGIQYVNATSQVTMVSNAADAFGFVVGSGKALSSAYFGSGFTIGSVYCVVGQYNGTRASILVNNSRVVGNKITGNAYADADFQLARRASNPYWAGKIYSVSVYYSVLSDTELTRIYQSGRDYVEASVGYYWNLNEGSGTTFYDWGEAWILAENWTLDLNGLSPAWHAAQTMILEVFTHSIIPGIQDSWFYVMIFVAFGAIVCFALIAKMLADGDYDIQVLGLLLLLGLIALLIVAGVILTV